MDRQEIIAAIDAEIERLQHARRLIVQSAAKKRSGGYQRRARSAKVEQQRVAPERRRAARAHASKTAAMYETPQVVVTRIPAKEPPKRRTARTAAMPTKQWSALTRDVPQGPVAVAAKSREVAAEPVNRPPEAISAFGQAITRGLASIGT